MSYMSLIESTLFASNCACRWALRRPASGIRSVQSINLSASYVSGVLNLVLCKPIMTLPITTLGVTAERDLVNQFASMPRIYDGACLNWLMLAGAATPVASPLSGHLEFGWK